MMKTNRPFYAKPQIVDRGAVEIRTKDHAGSVDPEGEHNDNIVWGNFTPQPEPIEESEK